MLKNMPTDIILNIQSFLLGEPHLYKIKHNTTLKAIQNKYKIDYSRPRLWNNLYINQTQMAYEMRREENIKPHMINNSTNLNRIVSFINQFQYGIPDYDEDEMEEIDLVDDIYDEVDIDDDNPMKVAVELSLLSEDQLFSERYGEIFKLKSHWTTKYTFDKPTKKLISKALGMFVEECQRFKQKKQRMIERNELLQSDFTHFEVVVFMKRDDDSDSEDSDDDNNSEED